MADQSDYKPGKGNLRKQIHTIIFEADTPAGKAFDLTLLAAILFSVMVVMLESIDSLSEEYGATFRMIEWALTVLFTIEYVLRIYSVKKPLHYIKSFYGVIDFISILPSYLSIILPGGQMFMIVRAIRLLRVFRILKLVYYLEEARMLAQALYASRGKISVFLFFVVLMVIIIGSIMYLVEGPQNPGFSNIPVSIYWAIVTLTTVGFGDIIPHSGLGRFLSALVMILGYAVLAVPTGIVTMELVKGKQTNTRSCHNCSAEGHDDDANYCKNCGHIMNDE